MSRFHESVREFLEDVFRFLSETLHQEFLSSRAITQKEALLMKLQMLHRLYPQLQLTLNSVERDSLPSPTSPTPYLDMQGYLPKKDDHETLEDSYELCGSEKSGTTENQSSFDVEDNQPADGCKYPAVAASPHQVFEIYGYLEKKGKERFGGLISKSQRRWCGIRDGLMYYYDKPTDQVQKGIIPLHGYEARQVQAKESKKKNYYCFELVCPGKHTYQFSTVSDREAKQWIAAIDRNSRGTTKPSGTGSRDEDQPEATDEDNENIYDDSCVADSIYEMVEDEEKNETDQGRSPSSDTLSTNSYSTDSKDGFYNNNMASMFDYQNLYVGLWDCKGDDDTELDFHYGDVIRIISKEYDSYAWWIGELNGKIGFVPKSYLMEAYTTY